MRAALPCHDHLSEPAIADCEACRRPICATCIVPTLGGTFCMACDGSARRRRLRHRLAAGLTLAAVAAGLVLVLWRTSARGGTATTAGAAIDPSEPRRLRRARAELVQAP